MKKKKTPEIIEGIIEFLKAYQNPNDEKGQHLSIQPYQILAYRVSYDFIFKWIITEKELKEVSNYTGFEIENNTLSLSFGEYNIELECSY